MNPKILLLYTSHRQLEEVKLQSLLYKKNGSSESFKNIDLLFYCNSPIIDKKILNEYLNELPHKNKMLFHTDKNIGYLWGGHEAVYNCFNIWKNYDYCIHLHPDVFILNDQYILKIIEDCEKNKEIDFINTHNLDPLKDDNKNYLSFDFFIFKPKQILQSSLVKNHNFFNLYLDENERIVKTPEHLLSQIIKKYNLKSKIVQRYDNNHWEPRRPDMIGLYHEHDLEKVKDIIDGNGIFPVFINIERFKERKEHCINLFSCLFPKEFYMFHGVDGKYVNVYDNKCKHNCEVKLDVVSVRSESDLKDESVRSQSLEIDLKEEQSSKTLKTLQPIAVIEYNNEYFVHNPNFRAIRMSYGEIGCYLSHRQLYQYVVDNNIKAMFICEDDLLASQYIYSFDDYLRNLPRMKNNEGKREYDFDICLFHHNPEFIKQHTDFVIMNNKEEKKKEKDMVDEKINDYYYKLPIRSRTNSQKFIQGLSYIITYKGAVKFLTRVGSNLHVPIDDQLGNAHLDIIYSKEVLFHQKIENFGSSIWNIYKENEDYENVKWDKEITSGSQTNILTKFCS